MNKRIKSLDILRGLCILLVLGHHLQTDSVPGLPTLVGAPGWLYWHIQRFGWCGVDLFFVLSGFLIGGLLFSELRNTNTLDCSRFWLRRGFKIWPSYFALLLVLGLTGATNYINTTSISTEFKSLAWHVFFLQNYLPDNPNANTWSLAVEEHFYMVLPLFLLGFVFLGKKTQKSFDHYILPLVISVVSICLLLRFWQSLELHAWHYTFGGIPPSADAVHKQTQYRLDSLLIGVFCRYILLFKPQVIQQLAQHRLKTLTLTAILLSPAFFLPVYHPIVYVFGFLTLAIGYGLLLLLVCGGLFDKFEKFTLASMFAMIGIWSYNIYLWHPFLTNLNFLYYADISRKLGHIPIPLYVQFAAQCLLYIGFSIGIGWAATQLIELPLLKLRDRLVPSRRKAEKPTNSAL